MERTSGYLEHLCPKCWAPVELNDWIARGRTHEGCLGSPTARLEAELAQLRAERDAMRAALVEITAFGHDIGQCPAAFGNGICKCAMLVARAALDRAGVK